jgi:HicB family
MRPSAERRDAGESSYSGRLLLRMPKTLHGELAARSDADGVSLNQFIVTALSRTISGEQAPDGPAAGVAPGRGRVPRSLRLALIANAVVVALAAVTAIALLLFAWH